MPCAGLLAPLALGSAVILPTEGRFSAGTFWRDASAHGATFFTAVRVKHNTSHDRTTSPEAHLLSLHMP